ncbi:hypothetical protein U1Q18_021376 [Sarracenia purpurea var. burkii]
MEKRIEREIGIGGKGETASSYLRPFSSAPELSLSLAHCVADGEGMVGRSGSKLSDEDEVEREVEREVKRRGGAEIFSRNRKQPFPCVQFIGGDGKDLETAWRSENEDR